MDISLAINREIQRRLIEDHKKYAGVLFPNKPPNPTEVNIKARELQEELVSKLVDLIDVEW